MTDVIQLPLVDAGATRLGRVAAFDAAGRHTRRVRHVRRLIIGGAIGAVVILVVLTVFDPFRNLPKGLSIGPVGIDGTRVSMANPKLSGFRKDGRPYQITSESAIQDVRKPNVLELHVLDAHFTMADQSVAHVVSRVGIYDSSAESMKLIDDVRITGASGYDVTMRSADIDFKTGDVVSNAPVKVTTASGTVTSDRMHLLDNGKHVTFEGNVHSVMQPGSGTPVEALKGTSP